MWGGALINMRLRAGPSLIQTNRPYPDTEPTVDHPVPRFTMPGLALGTVAVVTWMYFVYVFLGRVCCELFRVARPQWYCEECSRAHASVTPTTHGALTVIDRASTGNTVAAVAAVTQTCDGGTPSRPIHQCDQVALVPRGRVVVPQGKRGDMRIHAQYGVGVQDGTHEKPDRDSAGNRGPADDSVAAVPTQACDESMNTEAATETDPWSSRGGDQVAAVGCRRRVDSSSVRNRDAPSVPKPSNNVPKRHVAANNAPLAGGTVDTAQRPGTPRPNATDTDNATTPETEDPAQMTTCPVATKLTTAHTANLNHDTTVCPVTVRPCPTPATGDTDTLASWGWFM